MTKSLSDNLIKRQIKVAIRDLLMGKTNAKEKVFLSRSIPVDEENLPAIVIYSTNEKVERFNEAPKDYKRELTIAIECIANGTDDDDLDWQLEALAEDIESLMEVDETLGGLVNKLELNGSGYQQDSDGQNPLGSLVLQFTIQFFTDAIRPGSICHPDLEIAGVNWKVGHDGTEDPGNQIDATDSYIFEGEA